MPIKAIDEKQRAFLYDGMMLKIASYKGEPLGVDLPHHVELEVVEVGRELGTGSGAVKRSALLSNGMSTTVPGFVEVGGIVVVATADCAYVKRA